MLVVWACLHVMMLMVLSLVRSFSSPLHCFTSVELRLNILPLPFSSIGPIFFFRVPLKIDFRCLPLARLLVSCGLALLISSTTGTTMGFKKFSSRTLFARLLLKCSCTKFMSTERSRPLVSPFRWARCFENQLSFFDGLLPPPTLVTKALSSWKFWWLIHWLCKSCSMVGRREGVCTRMRSVKAKKINIDSNMLVVGRQLTYEA